ncbi:hypothetical protein [Actinoplanes sp. NPDC026623]|uniref:hypothetical protein n=1 Tax=Actinoplanes sp. NPDC026623 TaxID=3155610 RepID=UPI0033EEDF2A
MDSYPERLDEPETIIKDVAPPRAAGPRSRSSVPARNGDLLATHCAVRHDGCVSGDFLVNVVSDSPVSDEDLAEATRDLRDDLNELRGVEANEVAGPAAEGTRDATTVLLGVLGVSLFGIPTAMRAKADYDRLAKRLDEIIKRYQERHQGKKITIDLPDGTKLDSENMSEEGLAKVLRNLPQRSGVAVEKRKKVN